VDLRGHYPQHRPVRPSGRFGEERLNTAQAAAEHGFDTAVGR